MSSRNYPPPAILEPTPKTAIRRHHQHTEQGARPENLMDIGCLLLIAGAIIALVGTAILVAGMLTGLLTVAIIGIAVAIIGLLIIGLALLVSTLGL